MELYAEIDQAELACRICEAVGKIKRPAGATGAQALAAMDDVDRQMWSRGAVAALIYLKECVGNLQRSN